MVRYDKGLGYELWQFFCVLLLFGWFTNKIAYYEAQCINYSIFTIKAFSKQNMVCY